MRDPADTGWPDALVIIRVIHGARGFA